MRATAPVRTCDIGGWTDTWFGAPGRVLNLAVSPGVEVTISAAHEPQGGTHDRLVQAALWEYGTGAALDVQVCSSVPPGCALGTSAAVAVAIVGGLFVLRGVEGSLLEIARAAHHLETEVLGGESGVQDQLGAVYGGISHITVDRYPDAGVEVLPVWTELGELLTTVYLGEPHDSSAVHREVIASGDRSALDRLRATAGDAREAVLSRDLTAFGTAMTENTAAQRDLHPGIVGARAEDLIRLARRSSAIGWKVNGAGGDGGSVAILHASAAARDSFRSECEESDRWRVLPVCLCEQGLQISLEGS